MRVFGKLERVTRKVEFSKLSNNARGDARRAARGVNVTGWTHPLTFNIEKRTPHGEKLLGKRRRLTAVGKSSRVTNQRRAATVRRARQRRNARVN